ncbi:NmrA family NAD(P)-binding protein [Nocardia sp. R6R-6]|uniref:NmrA family NAD(P)-binding protein n=1 Tax=Nocardia sp. R6R-6 TaxID=3459303 RepID=UPI00403E1157
MPYNCKPVPSSVLIFGAGGHIGGPLARFLAREAPTVHLRLASRDSARAATLQAQFPHAEVVQADYTDRASLEAAVRDIEGIFVLTPSGTDEAPAMTGLVEACRSARVNPHVIRLLGMQPEADPGRIPQSLRDHGLGLPIQHPIAKAVLGDSGLPATFLNSGATFIDNFRWMVRALRERRTLVWPDRLIPYIDPSDIAEVAGRLFLSDNQRHIGQFHTMNNGQDILRFGEVAELMSDVWGEPIAYDGSRAGFFAEYAEMGDRRLDYLWEFFQYEQDNEVVWARNDFVERTIGRRPTSVREWLSAHRDDLLGP